MWYGVFQVTGVVIEIALSAAFKCSCKLCFTLCRDSWFLFIYSCFYRFGDKTSRLFQNWKSNVKIIISSAGITRKIAFITWVGKRSTWRTFLEGLKLHKEIRLRFSESLKMCECGTRLKCILGALFFDEPFLNWTTITAVSWKGCRQWPIVVWGQSVSVGTQVKRVVEGGNACLVKLDRVSRRRRTFRQNSALDVTNH